LPGDNINLYAVLEVFQKSPTLEDFEKSINDKEVKINNLDLNNDKLVDYIQVVSLKNGGSHSIILRVAVTKKENQDVAVIEVNKDRADNIVVQIIGDENLYGESYVLEPASNQTVQGTPNPGYIKDDRTVYYVNSWPVVSHLYSPRFSVYISPWHWGYYPSYWYSWAPLFYYDYWGSVSFYFTSSFYYRAPYIRYPVHYLSYKKVRNTSAVLIRNRNSGGYNATYNNRVFSKPIAPASNRTMRPTRQKPTDKPSRKPTNKARKSKPSHPKRNR
ncbi:MAG: hypothetical protein L3J46_04870, partial [Kangiellaceae bacterium]|nr:hypothetical protein [Kangiellaceae bacterium]